MPKRKIDADEVWATARSFSELLAANILFLQGKIDRTPSHTGPLDRESKPIRRLLISLNQLGLLTTGSQPGTRNQRAYVTGWMPKPKAVRLFNRAGVDRGIIAMTPSTGSHQGGQAFVVTIDGKRPHTFLGRSESVRYSLGKTVKGLLYVQFADALYGQRDWLFKRLAHHLRR